MKKYAYPNPEIEQVPQENPEKNIPPDFIPVPDKGEEIHNPVVIPEPPKQPEIVKPKE